ncbi:hypothetical protein BBJ28_00010528 [Nothophytophthora sp. Chile5]|nr:hypothetical protein BBJ28_00010528 [Nothophytophthora sp. Chile5]
MQKLVWTAALGVLLLVAWAAQLWGSSSLRGDEQSNEAHVSAGFAHMFATKTMYWDQREAQGGRNDASLMRALVALPALAETPSRALFRQELQLIQTQIVARHGIRYPTGGNIREIMALLKKLQPFVDDLPSWLQNYTLPYNMTMEGELATAGAREMQEFGARSLARSGQHSPVEYTKTKYRVAHTFVPRARDSAIA